MSDSENEDILWKICKNFSAIACFQSLSSDLNLFPLFSQTQMDIHHRLFLYLPSSNIPHLIHSPSVPNLPNLSYHSNSEIALFPKIRLNTLHRFAKCSLPLARKSLTCLILHVGNASISFYLCTCMAVRNDSHITDIESYRVTDMIPRTINHSCRYTNRPYVKKSSDWLIDWKSTTLPNQPASNLSTRTSYTCSDAIHKDF